MSVPYASFNPISLGNLINVKINDTTLANGNTIVYDSTTSLWNNAVVSAEVPLTFSTGLTRTVNTITDNLATGIVGGQTATGGTDVTDILKLKGTTGNGTSGSPAVQIITGNNGATTALTVLNSGNVGIGTTTPAHPLDVTGSARMTTIRDNTNGVGTSGQLLSSTGSALSWIAAPAAEVPLTFSTGLTRTVNTITDNLATGIVGGQTATGGTGVTDILKLKGTTGNGTSGSPAVQIITGNNGATTALTVLNSGNVGIGTTSPSVNLDVNGTGKFTTAVSNTQLTVNGTGAIKSGVNFANGSTNYGEIYFDNNAPYDMSIYQKVATGSLILGTNTTERMRITSAGNVGIGTTAPTFKLHVEGSGTADEIVGWFNNQGAFSSSIAVRNSSKTAYLTNHQGLSTPTYTGQLSSALALGVGAGVSPIQFWNGSPASAKMTILENGNVGIGTTAPASKLHVVEPTTTSGSAGIFVEKTGVTSGNSYGVLAQTTGAGVNNYGGFFTASGATNNYGLVVSAGNVGIGTTAPAHALDVTGSARMTTIRDSTNGVGTSGQLLSSTGSALSWIAAPAAPLGMCIISERQVAGTSSSVAFSGTTTVLRQLNTVTSSNLSIVAPVAPNWTFTIPTAGTYSFAGRACYSPKVAPNFAAYTTSARLHLRNDTLGLDNAITGDTSLFFREYSTVAKTPDNIWLNIDGILTLTAGTVMAMKQHTVASDAAFNPCIGGTAINVSGVGECYATLTITKIA